MDIRQFQTGPGKNYILGGWAGVALGAMLLLLSVRSPAFGLLGLITFISGWGLLGIGVSTALAHRLEHRMLDLQATVMRARGAELADDERQEEPPRFNSEHNVAGGAG